MGGSMKLYAVRLAENPEEDNFNWELTGVYDSRDKAVSECKNCDYFIYEVSLNSPHVENVNVDPEWPMVCFKPKGSIDSTIR